MAEENHSEEQNNCYWEAIRQGLGRKYNGPKSLHPADVRIHDETLMARLTFPSDEMENPFYQP